MEHQHSARTVQHEPPRRAERSGPRPRGASGGPPRGPRLPRPTPSSPLATGPEALARRESVSVYQAAPRPGMPRARLTGLGAGVLATLLMALTGALDALVLGGSPAVYGVVFCLVSTVAAGWVRPADLLAGPVVVPIAFAVGVFFIGSESDGVSGLLMNGVSALALHAGWLYAGTLLAVAVAFVRRARIRSRRSDAERPDGPKVAGIPGTLAGLRGLVRAGVPKGSGGPEGPRDARRPRRRQRS
ncbi:DUF6542 domain-containing protein [Streptomyces sp. AJS327]|uniref:DUF6542 domain-containing protein n=1 Tax=Streptomyces sp. AJS327 TaxID=2545265 RepID=UPI0015DEB8C2|nr:DUF6542 domain-containing protein [Streptomyces sp. AJS327]